jgi:hypothetical protein
MPEKEIVWQCMIKDRYIVRVTRAGLFRGLPTVSKDGSVVHQQQTGLRYDAIFGPQANEIAR